MSENRVHGAPPPVSDCEVRDPRVWRTRQLLQDALRGLMRSKGFDEISVQDIAEAATVNRATFYDHYTDKYALLEALVASGFHRLLAERKVRYEGTCPSAAGPVILATCDYLLQNFTEESECRRQSAFEPLIDAAMIRSIRRVLLGGLTDRFKDSNHREMIATTVAWAICGAAKQWVRSAERTPAEAVVPEILKIVMPLLESQGGASR